MDRPPWRGGLLGSSYQGVMVVPCPERKSRPSVRRCEKSDDGVWFSVMPLLYL